MLISPCPFWAVHMICVYRQKICLHRDPNSLQVVIINNSADERAHNPLAYS